MASTRILLGFLAATALTGCATVANNQNQNINLIVRGSDSAYCVFQNDEYKNTVGFHNNGTMNLERSRKPLVVDCWGDNSRYTRFKISSALAKESALNVGVGVIPGLGYDALAGGLWNWPDPIIVDFREIEVDPPKPQPQWPSEVLESMSAKSDTVTDADVNPNDSKPLQSPLPVESEPLAPPAEAAKYISSIGKLPVEAHVTPAPLRATEERQAETATALQMKPVSSPEDYKKPAASHKKRTAAKPKKPAEQTAAPQDGGAHLAKTDSAAQQLPEAATTQQTPPPPQPEVTQESGTTAPAAEEVTPQPQTTTPPAAPVPADTTPPAPSADQDEPLRTKPLLDVAPLPDNADTGTGMIPDNLKL